MPKAAQRSKGKKAPSKKPTSARLLKNRPHDPEPIEDAKKPEEKPEAAGEPLESEPRSPRQARLPEMEDPEIEEIENAALDYVEVRDRRQQLTAQEVPAKQKLLDLMKAHDKTHYKRDGIEVTRVVEKEKVRVRVKKESSDEP
jgi:hypothetical protein